jgi:signal transduction histidine kinase
MRFPVTNKVYLGFAILFLFSATIGISEYFTIKEQGKVSESITRSYVVMNSLDEIQNLVTKMESNRRGLRCTHEKNYLDQYYLAQQQLSPAITDVSKLVENDSGQSARVASLEKSINNIIFFWSRLRLDENTYDSTQIALITADENQQMNSINASIKDILKKEDSLQNVGEEDNKRMIDFLAWSSPAATITEQVFILALIFLVINELQKRKKAEADLQKSLQKEIQLNELKSRFVSMASHEFRTPLASVLASTYLAAKYKTTEEEPKRQKHYGRIASAVHNLTEILEDLLSVDKLEVGKVQVRLHDLNIEEYIKEQINEIHTILKRGQTVHYEHSGSTEASLDTSLLKHILTNLLSNAIKFSKDNSLINVHSYHNGTQLMISVKDTGIGIPRNDQPHLFDRFHRGANVSDIEGTGLGLHIVAKYTKLMNGDIKCISEEGAGTEFILTFPQTVKSKKAEKQANIVAVG